MTLQPSRIVEQMRGIPFFVGKSSSNCSVCGRPLTAHESVARGIGPVCVRKHMGPGKHPSGSSQSAHAGKRGKRKPLSELVKMRPDSITRTSTGIEGAFVKDYGKEGKVLYKINSYGTAESELMAYEFSDSIGWNIVPKTIMPKGTKDVSVQRWIEGQSPTTPGALRSFELGFNKDDRILIMDILLQNHDRHSGNILVGKGGKQWAIDNNMAFNAYHTREGVKKYNYGSIKNWSRRLRVTKGRAGLINAARDVTRWSKTREYLNYLNRVSSTLGPEVRFQFSQNVELLADWSRKAKVME